MYFLFLLRKQTSEVGHYSLPFGDEKLRSSGKLGNLLNVTQFVSPEVVGLDPSYV
jgi:hypothetical protein